MTKNDKFLSFLEKTPGGFLFIFLLEICAPASTLFQLCPSTLRDKD